MHPTRKPTFLIIGAGPTGLGAVRQLLDQGEDDFLILEASDRPGGLAASYVDEHGFTWDIGCHLLFSHYDRVDRCLVPQLASVTPLRWELSSFSVCLPIFPARFEDGGTAELSPVVRCRSSETAVQTCG
jgi:phytoene dehydrogenase-like protein